MSPLAAITRRELATTLGGGRIWFAAALMLAASVVWALLPGRWITLGRAELTAAFIIAPWLLAVAIPALTAGQWADERRSGMGEVWAATPAPLPTRVLGKWLAAGAAGLALTLATTPMAAALAVLGQPDFGAIVTGYALTLLLAGAFAGLAQFASALTASAVGAYAIAVGLGLGLTALGAPWGREALRRALGPEPAELLAWLSPLAHLEAGQRGVLEASAIAYFVGLTAMFLTLAGLAVAARRGG